MAWLTDLPQKTLGKGAMKRRSAFPRRRPCSKKRLSIGDQLGGALCNDTNITIPLELRKERGASSAFYVELFTYYLQMIRNNQFPQARKSSLPVSAKFHDPDDPSFECDWGISCRETDIRSEIARFFYGP
jgi:hypothetical protein